MVEPSREEVMEIDGAVPWPSDRPCEPHMHTWLHVFTDTAAGFQELLNDHVRCYLELGVWCGGSAVLASRFAPNAQLICIDAWDGRGGFQYDPKVAAQSLLLTQANLWDIRDRVTLVRSDTIAGMQAAHHAGAVPEVIYIDADHHYDPARRDIATAMALFPEALICGDDYDEACGRAADDIAGEGVRVVGRKFWWIDHP